MDDAPDALQGHAAEAGGTDVAEAVLVLSGEVAKLAIVLSELDEDSFSRVRARLKVFNDLVAQLPKDPVKRAARVRVIGFSAPGTSRKRRSRS